MIVALITNASRESRTRNNEKHHTVLHLLHSSMRSTGRNPHSALQRPRRGNHRLRQGQRDHEGAPQTCAQEAILALHPRRRRSQDRRRPSRR